MNTEILFNNPAIDGDFTESIRLLRDSVQNGLRNGEKVVLITSTAPEEGKSVVAVNLAAILAKNDKKVLLIDADLRNSDLSKRLQTSDADFIRTCSSDKAEGLGGNEDGESPLCRIQNCSLFGMDLLTFDTKTYHPRQIIRTDQMRKLVDSLRKEYDLILIDTPPCGIVSDTAVIADAVDVILYVVRQDKVLTSRIRNGIHTLLSTEARLMGCVLNGSSIGRNRYGYSYGYGRYSGKYFEKSPKPAKTDGNEEL